jgi:hypothetical protein
MATFITIIVGVIGVAAMLGALYLVENHHPARERKLREVDLPLRR